METSWGSWQLHYDIRLVKSKSSSNFLCPGGNPVTGGALRSETWREGYSQKIWMQQKHR